MEQLSPIISVLLMSFAVSMDAFSVSVSLGMQNIRLKGFIMMGSVIGLFHVTFPFIGMMIGQYISQKVTFITELTGGFILIFIGTHMIFSSIQERPPSLFPRRGVGLVIVALLVSIDSFPAGLSIGMFALNKWYVVICFGLTAMFVSWIGMFIGKKVHVQIGTYSEIIGGILLFVIGLYIIL